MIRLLTCAIFLILLYSSCSIDIEKNIDLQKENFFFSTDTYFAAEINRLNNYQGYTKYVNFNGREETMVLDTLNLVEEFLPFQKCDINKVIWSDQYSCDTTFSQNKVVRINCKSLNSKLKTKTLDVEFVSQNPSSIHITCEMNKMLLKTEEFLTYKQDSFYQIKRIQQLKSGGIDSTLLKVSF